MSRKLITALAISALLAGCSGSREQTMPYQESSALSVRLLRIEPLEPGEYKTQVNVVLRVQNPSTEAIKMRGAELELNFTGDALTLPEEMAPPTPGEGGAVDEEPGEPGAGGDGEIEVEVFEGESDGGGTIPAGAHLDIPISVWITYPENPRAYIAFCKLGVANLDVEGVVHTDRGDLSFEDVGEIPTPTLPEPTADQVQVAVANAGQEGSLSLVLKLFNANTFSWKIKDWDYKVYVAGKLMREATVALGERIQPNTAIQYSVGLLINEKTFGPEARRLLSSDAIPYRIEGRLRFGEITMPTNIQDEVTFSR